jgi:hypothetical protein
LRSRFLPLLVLFAVVLAAGACAREKKDLQPPKKAPEAAADDAKTPQLIAAPAPTATTPAPSESKGYFAEIDQALLFDPRMGPINALLSNEPGVHLLVTGKIGNDSGRLLHRAKVYATVVAIFPERTEIERHSGGLGFSPRVTSLDPWRPETERAFACVTRPLDPIYLELTPEKVMAAITLTAQDPLTYRLREEITNFPVPWKPLLGVATERPATLIVDGQGYCAPKIRACQVVRQTAVTVLYQRGAAYKVIDGAGALRWVAYDQLAVGEPVGEPADLPRSFPIRQRLASGLEIDVNNVAEYQSHPAVKHDGKLFVVDLRLTNRGEKAIRTPQRSNFALDLSAGQYTATLNPIPRADGAYSPGLLRPEESVRASLFFAQTGNEWDFPFDLEMHRNRETPVRWPLFPALLAAQEDNGQ